ncbi:hypothetical protein C8R44DRAFT_871774 [Mycena epipterygia]|nr:hypothetical protein C8R44DRAFT_871774 [Mycena epipterygia]
MRYRTPTPLSKITRIRDPNEQYSVLRHCGVYKRDGKGAAYITTRIPVVVADAVRKGILPATALTDATEIKVGHTNCMERRLCQYDQCIHNSLEVTWRAYYLADQRMKVGAFFSSTVASVKLTLFLAERLVHLAFRAKGAQPVIYECPGCKKTKHIEFYKLRDVGGYTGAESDVVDALRATDQRRIRRVSKFKRR